MIRRWWSTSITCLLYRRHDDCGGVTYGSPFHDRCECRCHR